VALLPLEVVVAQARRPARVGRSRFHFPDPRKADADGLLATGGDLEPPTLLAAYRQGVFPWPIDGIDLVWWSPDPRAVLPPQGLHVSRSLARTLRRGRFRITIDAAFDEVLAGCAEPRGEDDDTWITPAIRKAYVQLHRLGWAHSVEVWADGALAGGLYGVSIGALFAAESMFHRAKDASKVALVALAQHARAVGVQLVDVQMPTPHLTSMGAVTMTRDDYLRALARAIACSVDFTGGRP
jgi:leucyl/phenylalanyl-tRNA--protein transferase